MYDHDKPDLNELAHYGVLGMKWGVRKARYEDSNASGITIKKGQTINRIASAGDEKQSGMKYAAYEKEDVDNYEMLLGGSGKFNFTYKATTNLVSPNEKRQVDAFLETVNEMSVSKAASILKTKSKLSSLKGIEKELDKALEGNDKSKVKTYDKFMDLLYAKELEPLRTQYFNKLSKEGYNMIIDSSDKGAVSNNPIIIFNGSKSLSFISKKEIEDVFE